jgi:hypothetical protein
MIDVDVHAPCVIILAPVRNERDLIVINQPRSPQVVSHICTSSAALRARRTSLLAASSRVCRKSKYLVPDQADESASS